MQRSHRHPVNRQLIDGQTRADRAVDKFVGYFGSLPYLVWQTVAIAMWITVNTVWLAKGVRWDPYPFILLNLAFSTQAAYAAPLILLAQNRQDERDRATIERDRQVAARTQDDTEYLARELASVRLALADVVTAQDLEDSLSQLAKLITDPPPPDAVPPDAVAPARSADS